MAKQSPVMLVEFQNGGPFKWLEIRVLRRSWETSAPNARNNLHSARRVYLMPPVLTPEKRDYAVVLSAMARMEGFQRGSTPHR